MVGGSMAVGALGGSWFKMIGVSLQKTFSKLSVTAICYAAMLRTLLRGGSWVYGGWWAWRFVV